MRAAVAGAALVLAASAIVGVQPEPASAAKRLLVAGDIASCAWRGDEATAALVARRRGLVLTAGDNVYQRGTRARFRACYGPSWGRFRARTRPVPGNHDRATPGAAGYFAYFGQRAGPPGRGYYAFDVGPGWRVYALDSTRCAIEGCDQGSAQYRWLRQDLEHHPRACSLAVLHHPHYSSGRHGNSGFTRPLLRLLYEAGAEIVVNGHDHVYERFAPARPWGRIDYQHGLRQFIVGTGGAPLYGWKRGRPAHSRARQNRMHGVLQLDLSTDGYGWRFLPVRGSYRDRGQGSCHAPPAAATQEPVG